MSLVLLAAIPGAAATPTCSGTACATNQDAPVWTQVMLSDGTTQVDYFRYFNTGNGGSGVTETAPGGGPMGGNSSPDALQNSIRPPYTYLYSDIASSANPNGSYEYGTSYITRNVCNLSNQSTTFADYSVHSATGGFPATLPAEFNESRLESGLKGIDVYAAFDGNLIDGLSPVGDADEVFFYSDQQCTFGGHEYGFYKDITAATVANWPGTISFYYSDHTNCGSGSCNASDGIADERVATYSISYLSNNHDDWIKYYFAAYFVSDSSAPSGYLIRVQVVDPSTYALETCANVTVTYSPNVAPTNANGYTYPVTTVSAPGQTTGPCTFDIMPASWYRADLVGNGSGYLFAGVQVSGNPDTVGNTPGLWINSFSVGK